KWLAADLRLCPQEKICLHLALKVRLISTGTHGLKEVLGHFLQRARQYETILNCTEENVLREDLAQELRGCLRNVLGHRVHRFEQELRRSNVIHTKVVDHIQFR